MQLHLQRARRIAQLALSVLVLTLAARFAWTARAQWEAAKPPPVLVPVAPKTRIAPAPPAPKPAAAPSEPEPTGALVRVVLSVSHGERRSEVLLDGMHLGHTTYAGDVSCRLGTNLALRIVPAHGAPIDKVLPCDGRNLVVRVP
jgi:hypothetical protein